MLRLAVLGAAGAAAGACSPTDLVNALAPRGGYTIVPDLPYGSGARRRLDLYLPDSRAPRTPLVVFFYGGRWQAGRKEDFLFVAQAFASRGVAVAVPDIRLYPELRFPGFLEDAAAAVAWLQREGGRHGVPAGGPVVLAGHSSGAHVAAMLALDERWLSASGAARPAGLLGIAGPYDFLPLTDADLRDLFHADRDPSALPGTQPIFHAGSDDPPALLLTGGADTTVRPGNSHRLAARLNAAGARAAVVEYPGLGHVGIIAALAAPLRASSAPVLRDAAGFIEALAARHPAPPGA
jgi:acetyl esterase/lipase